MKNKKIVIYILLFFTAYNCLAQQTKPIIDSVAYKNWAAVGGVQISNDGKFVIYTIDNDPVGGKTTVLKSTDGKWEKKYTGSHFADFSANSKIAFIAKPGGRKYIVSLKDKKQVEIPDEVRYIKELGLLTYVKEERLIIENPLSLKKEAVIADVKEYRFIEGSYGILITQKDKKTENLNFTWYDIQAKKSSLFWKGDKIDNIISSKDGRRIAFVAEYKDPGVGRKICTYQYPDVKAEVVFEENKLKGQKIENLRMFCANNKNLVVTLLEKEDSCTKDTNAVDLNIWSYKDEKLQPKQLMAPVIIQTALIDGKSKSLIPLTEGDEYLKISEQSKSAKWGLIDKYFKSKALKAEITKEVIAVSLTTGKKIKMSQKLVTSSMVSPDGKFLIYYDGKEQNFFTHELSTGITRNITNGIKTEWGIYPKWSRGVAGWRAGDQEVLIYDKYDIWQVDPLGKGPAINVTNQFGAKNNIRFNLLLNKNEDNVIVKYSDQILSAFDLNTHENGFWQIVSGKIVDPKQLFMGKYLFNAPDQDVRSFMPLKAKAENTYVLKRMSANESPNYYSTRDFKTFTALSAVCPEKKWNWLSSELHLYDQTNKYKGTLYKPENFDPSKKYPVILYYYEKLSHRVNSYLAPEYSSGMIDIPTFVSRGYLIFCPDIEYKIGYPGESAMKCVTSAADYLSTLPYIDKDNMSINGHSFGGFETNYIVTHSNRFKAACSGVGPTNLISFYGGMSGGDSRQGFVENGQIRIGKSLWEDKDLYIKNSPIFDADKVSTPLLIFHGNEDEGVPVAQSIEFFNALHRLKKPVWFLQYMNAGHSISKQNDRADFTIRLQQFFDHYLKGAAPPKWMTMGRPAKLKGIEERLELDTSGAMP
ncbi:alpha/beta hydrolase family protein [Pedobacter steynii]